MKSVKGYYSLIQYCPDKSKCEAVNIGLVMFAPELSFLNSKITEANNRIAKFFGRNSYIPDRINFLKESLQRRLENEKSYMLSFEDFDKFIKTRANDLLLTTPRSVKIIDVQNPENEFDQLYSQLIGSCSFKKHKKVLFPDLDNQFRTRLYEKVQFDRKFQIPGYNRVIDIPYSYQNGKLNLIDPHEFGPQGIDTGFRLVTEGKLIEKKGIIFDGEGTQAELIIIPKIDEKIQNPVDMRATLKSLFNEFAIRSVWEEQQDEFIQQVEREAHKF